MADAWSEFCGIVREIEALEGASGLLEWDQQTMMPAGGSGPRAAQIAALAKVIHERLTQPRLGELLDQLERADLADEQAAGVRNLRRTWNRATRVPSSLVTQIAEAQSEAFHAWLSAKQNADFATLAPRLERLVDLVRERAVAVDPHTPVYDVLLDEYDPGTTVATLRPMFARLRSGLVELMDAIRGAQDMPEYRERFEPASQRGLHHDVLAAMGFDANRGRLDDSEHPFSIGLSGDDVRITTHIYPDDLLSTLSGTIHEGGHALYEQGLPARLRGTYVSRAASFGLHESQSRFWENYIGRSRPFTRWLAGRLADRFPGVPADPDVLYAASNRVKPGLIRIKADEVTYNLHIIVRFELEVELFEGRLTVADLPEAWNARYREYLGLQPDNDAVGVMQDVHWASGALGYFPSYTLGNLYAASIGKVAEAEIPDLWAQVEAGQMRGLREWLRVRVHDVGSRKFAPEIVRDVVGEQDLVGNLLDYLWGRHGALYGVSRR